MSSVPRVTCTVWLAAGLLAAACSPEGDGDAPLSPAGRLSGDTAGYPKATEPRPFEFPADHGPHPRYKHEWWYVTGQATAAGERRFGFQLTIFREAIAPEPADSPSRWATSQLYLAHAAVTDVAGGEYLSDERFARGALELAGASATPFRVWLEDWALRGEAEEARLDGRLTVDSERFGFDLAIRSTGAPVAHGEAGLSAKGAAGSASYYYSYTRLSTRGTVRVDGESFDVSGESWLDHEWSSSALADHQSGWDWFSLQLSGGEALMIFRLRHRDEAERDFYSGTFIDASGAATPLSSSDIDLRALDHWTSERTGVRYPVRWRVVLPGPDLDVTIEPRLENQEFVHSFRYWEGAVSVSGRHGGRDVSGQGYVELTGYGAATAGGR